MCITTHQRYIVRVDSQNFMITLCVAFLQISVIIAEATVTMGRQHISIIALSVTLCCLLLCNIEDGRLVDWCIIEYILNIQ